MRSWKCCWTAWTLPWKRAKLWPKRLVVGFEDIDPAGIGGLPVRPAVLQAVDWSMLMVTSFGTVARRGTSRWTTTYWWRKLSAEAMTRMRHIIIQLWSIAVWCFNISTVECTCFEHVKTVCISILDRGLMQAATCKVCPAGRYSEEFAEDSLKTRRCTECPPGYSQGEPFTSECEPCGRGTFADRSGSESCQPCGVGFFQDGSAQTQCLQCPDDRTTQLLGWVPIWGVKSSIR